MSERFVIGEVLGKEEWTGNFGPMVSYRLELEGGQKADLNQQPQTPAPQAGDAIEGHLEPSKGDFPPKLKKDQQGFAGRSGGRSPSETASIVRQHSQEMALRILALTKPEMATNEQVRHMLRDWTDWFQADASGSWQPESQQVHASPESTPAKATDNGGPTGFAPGGKQERFLRTLLKEAGVGADDVNTVCSYFDATATGGREGAISQAIDELKQDAGHTSVQLVAEAEEWQGQQSDLPPPDDSGLPELEETTR